MRDGEVTIDGWTRTSGTTAASLAADCAAAGVARLLVTSTARDGSLAGPDVELLAEVLPAGLPVIAAGGISSIADLIAVRDLGCEAAVAGSALLAGRFTLAEARAPSAGESARDRVRSRFEARSDAPRCPADRGTGNARRRSRGRTGSTHHAVRPADQRPPRHARDPRGHPTADPGSAPNAR